MKVIAVSKKWWPTNVTNVTLSGYYYVYFCSEVGNFDIGVSGNVFLFWNQPLADERGTAIFCPSRLESHIVGGVCPWLDTQINVGPADSRFTYCMFFVFFNDKTSKRKLIFIHTVDWNWTENLELLQNFHMHHSIHSNILISFYKTKKPIIICAVD